MNASTDARLFRSLLRASRTAFTKGSYESAAYALAAALYQAAEQANAAGVLEVARLAREQEEWLDANRPGHSMSSAGARARGEPEGFYAVVLRKAEAWLEQRAAETG